MASALSETFTITQPMVATEGRSRERVFEELLAPEQGRILERGLGDPLEELTFVAQTGLAECIRTGHPDLNLQRCLPSYVAVMIGHPVTKITGARWVGRIAEVEFIPQRAPDPDVLIPLGVALPDTMSEYQNGMKHLLAYVREGDETDHNAMGISSIERHPHSGPADHHFRKAKKALAQEAVGVLTLPETAFALDHFNRKSHELQKLTVRGIN